MTYSIPDLADHPWAKLHPEYFADEPVTPLPPSGEERSLDILQRLRWFPPVTPRPARIPWLRIEIECWQRSPTCRWVGRCRRAKWLRSVLGDGAPLSSSFPRGHRAPTLSSVLGARCSVLGARCSVLGAAPPLHLPGGWSPWPNASRAQGLAWHHPRRRAGPTRP